jgi:hypothetical protein
VVGALVVGTLGAYRALVTAVAKHLGETGYLMGGEHAGPFVEGVGSGRLDPLPAVNSEVGVVERLVQHGGSNKALGISHSDSSTRSRRCGRGPRCVDCTAGMASGVCARGRPAARTGPGRRGRGLGRLLMVHHNQDQLRHNDAVGASHAHLDAATRLHRQEGRQQVDQDVRLTRRNVLVHVSACAPVLTASSQGPPPHRHGPGNSG